MSRGPNGGDDGGSKIEFKFSARPNGRKWMILTGFQSINSIQDSNKSNVHIFGLWEVSYRDPLSRRRGLLLNTSKNLDSVDTYCGSDPSWPEKHKSRIQKLNQEWNASRNSIGARMTSSRTAVWVISMIDSLFSNGDLSCQDPAATGHSKQRPKGSRTQLCPKQNPITPIWKAYTTWFFAVS